MEHEFKQIEQALDKLHQLQSGHIESFSTPALPDIEQQSAEREVGFRLLKKIMTEFIRMAETRTDEDTESRLRFFKTRIETLLEQNKMLETKVRAYRDAIRDNIRNLSKGRQVINRYGSLRGLSKNPKVISITN